MGVGLCVVCLYVSMCAYVQWMGDRQGRQLTCTAIYRWILRGGGGGSMGRYTAVPVATATIYKERGERGEERGERTEGRGQRREEERG